MIPKLKGQIGTSTVIGWGVALLMATTGSFMANVRHTDSKVDKFRIDNETTLEKVAKVEEKADNLEKRLDRIEGKIDKLLERK